MAGRWIRSDSDLLLSRDRHHAHHSCSYPSLLLSVLKVITRREGGGRVLGVHGAGSVRGPPCPAVTKVGLVLPYKYGRIVCMKKTLHIDEVLLRDARSASRAKTDTDTVRLGLEALIRQAAYQRLRALRGTEPGARDVPRRRERAASTAHSAA